jgi:hypothetical protein
MRGIHIPRCAAGAVCKSKLACVHYFSSASGPAGSAAQGGEAYRLVGFPDTDSLAVVFEDTAGSAERLRVSCMPAAFPCLSAFRAAGRWASGRDCPRGSLRHCRRRHCHCQMRVPARSSKPAMCQYLSQSCIMKRNAPGLGSCPRALSREAGALAW